MPRIVKNYGGSGKSEFGQARGYAAQVERATRIDLGLALLSVLARPGVPLSQHDIAAWCGCARGYIHLVEKKALRKLRNRLRFMHDARLEDAMEHLFYGRTAAIPKERMAA